MRIVDEYNTGTCNPCNPAVMRAVLFPAAIHSSGVDLKRGIQFQRLIASSTPSCFILYRLTLRIYMM